MFLLARASMANRALIVLITLFVALFGVLSMRSMKQELIPSLEIPAISVVSAMPGASAEVVDELCWTIVPALTGGDAVRIATGAEVEVALRPALLLEQDGTLLGRWLVE